MRNHVNSLLAQSFAAILSRVVKSTIKHELAGRVFITSAQFRRWMIFRHYSGTLTYENLCSKSSDKSIFVEWWRVSSL